jgi:hypothetical protein
MVHVFQAFPFSKSSEAIERIGWWAKLGIPLIRELQSRHPIQHTDTKVGSCEREQNLPPLLLGRRHRSIPC